MHCPRPDPSNSGPRADTGLREFRGPHRSQRERTAQDAELLAFDFLPLRSRPRRSPPPLNLLSRASPCVTARGRRPHRAPARMAARPKYIWTRIRIHPLTSPLTESNRRPSPYHGDALPTELRGPAWARYGSLRQRSRRASRAYTTAARRGLASPDALTPSLSARSQRAKTVSRRRDTGPSTRAHTRNTTATRVQANNCDRRDHGRHESAVTPGISCSGCITAIQPGHEPTSAARP
jgi:hypothetical protein